MLLAHAQNQVEFHILRDFQRHLARQLGEARGLGIDGVASRQEVDGLEEPVRLRCQYSRPPVSLARTVITVPLTGAWEVSSTFPLIDAKLLWPNALTQIKTKTAILRSMGP